MRALVVLSALVWLVGCATVPPTAPALTPPPSLRFEPLGEPRATIVALHGFNDRKAAFMRFGAAASDAGVRVIAYDQAGFGAQPDRGHWPGTERLVADLHRALRDARALAPERPVFVLGESMGAAVALAGLARPEAPAVDGVMLAAPAVWGGDRFNPLLRASLWLTATIAPGLELSARGLDVQASDNIAMLRALGRDPLYLPTATAANVQGLVRLMDEALAAAPHLAGRRLVLVGARDEIVPAEAYAALLERLAGPDCTVVRYPDGWHLLLRDHQRARVFDDILAWIAGDTPTNGEIAPCGGPMTLAVSAPAAPAAAAPR